MSPAFVIILIAIVAAIGAACYFLFSGAKDQSAAEKAAPKQPAKEISFDAAKATEGADAAKGAVAETVKEQVEQVISVKTNSTGYITEIVIGADGRRRRRIREQPSIWNNSTDVLLATALQAPLDQELPPWPGMGPEMDAEFLANAEQKPTKILPGDSESVRAIKQVVASVREEVVERVKNGEHFCDILNAHRDMVNDSCKARADVLKGLVEVRKTGTQADVDHYLLIMNAALQQLNIEPINLDDHKRRDPRRSVRKQEP